MSWWIIILVALVSFVAGFMVHRFLFLIAAALYLGPEFSLETENSKRAKESRARGVSAIDLSSVSNDVGVDPYR